MTGPNEDDSESIGPYRLDEVLGRGGMGIVYRATHEKTGEVVALKTVRAPTEGMLASIRREIHALGLSRHPGVVEVRDEGLWRGVPWYAMPLLTGETLRDRLNAHPGPIEVRSPRFEAALDCVRRLAATLSFLHGRGVVHHDLKPENIFLRDGNEPVLVDFGIATRFHTGQGREVLESGAGGSGSALYMAPEQIRREPVDARADLYALGCILYEMVTGAAPFRGSPRESIPHQHLTKSPELPSKLVPDLPSWLDALIVRLLAKRRQDRVAYADDVVDALAASGQSAHPGREKLPSSPAYLYRPELSGRDEVLASLGGAIRKLAGGRGALLLVGGESGVGKTRLAMEIASRATWHGLAVSVAECLPLGVPLSPLRRLMQAMFDRSVAEGPAETARLFGARAKVLLPYEPQLADLPGFDELPDPVVLPPDGARARVLRALRDSVLAFAEASPLLLFLDDLQWADELSLAFLQELARADLASHPLLVLATYRADEVGDGPLRDFITARKEKAPADCIELSRLDPAGVSAMVGSMLGLSEKGSPLLAFVAEQSNGNPFFVAEWLRAAIAGKLITRTGASGFRLAASAEKPALASLGVPAAIAQLVERRLSDLSESAWRFLRAGAVLGRTFDLEVLRAMEDAVDEPPSWEGRGGAQEVVESLRFRQILEDSATGQLRFVHDRLREIAYGTLEAEDAERLHRRAAGAIEDAHRDTPSFAEQFPALAHHFARAGEHEPASRYFRRAADHAKATYAQKDAVAFYESSLREARAASPADERSWSSFTRDLLEDLGDARAFIGRQLDARSALEEALRTADTAPQRARLLRKLGKTCETHHDHPAALRYYDEGEQVLDTAKEGLSGEALRAWRTEWVSLQIDRIMVNYYLARTGEIEPLLAKLEAGVDAHGTPLQRYYLYRGLTYLHLRRERYALSEETLARAQAALEAALESGHEGEILVAKFMVAFAFLFHGDAAECRARILRDLPDCERSGDLTLLSRYLAYILLAERRLGNVDGTEKAALRCLEVAEDAGMTEYVGLARAQLGWVAWRRGDIETARRECSAALPIWARLSLVYPLHWVALLPLMMMDADADPSRVPDHARRMLEATQQALPEPLGRALSRVVSEAEAGGDVRAAAAATLDSARTHGFI